MSVAIITGVSKGFGFSIAEQLLKKKISVIGISREDSKSLKELAQKGGVFYKHYSYDLSDLDTFEKGLQSLSALKQKPKRFIVINNAAVLDPIDPSIRIEPKELSYHMHVNVIAPMVLLNFFLKKGTKENIPVMGINITSGAARRPIYGWSAYGSGKAAIDLYTETIALEQEILKTGHKIIAFNPGVMDTAMQERIRNTTEDQFQDVKTFQTYHKQNQLKNPKKIAKLLMRFVLEEIKVENGKVYDPSDVT